MTAPFVNLSNSKRPGDDTYSKVIEQIHQDKVCPFCPEHLATYHKNPILFEGRYWTITTNMYPYKNTKHHFLLIHTEHITDSKDILSEGWQELHKHINKLTKDYNIEGGTFLMRCGDTSHTGASVTHLHAHLAVPDKEAAQCEPILVRIG